MKFSDTSISKLKPKPERYYLYDSSEPRLGVVVHPTGRMVFHVRMTINGRTRRITVAKAGDLKVHDVRAKAAEVIANVARGDQPVMRSVTLAKATEQYLKLKRRDSGRLELKASTKDDYIKRLTVTFAGYMDTPLANISDEDIATIYARRHPVAPAATATALRYFSAVWNFSAAYPATRAAFAGKTNPTKYLSTLSMKYTAPRRQTRIADADLPAWWAAVQTLKPVDRDLLTFCLLTGCRVGTTGSGGAQDLTWNDIEQEWFTLRDSKNRKDLRLPLPPVVSELLEQRRTHPEDKVFPDADNGRRAYSAVERISGIKATMHDLRRTFATAGANVIGAVPLKILMGHSLGGDVTAGYIIPSPADLQAASAKVVEVLHG